MVGMRNVFKILVGNPAREDTLVSLRRRWEGNIKMDTREIGWEYVDWIH
jgi:hypothetical protein